jgi:hypothetical protein
MRLGMILAGMGAVGLCSCADYHQEVVALRMARPTAESRQLAAYAPPNPDYPSVGGDILRGTAPKSTAAYDASVDPDRPPPDVK